MNTEGVQYIEIETTAFDKILEILKKAVLNGITGFEDRRKLTGFGNTRSMSFYFVPTNEGGHFVFHYEGNGRKIELKFEDPRKKRKWTILYEKEM